MRSLRMVGLITKFWQKKILYYYLFFRILYYYLEKKKKKKVHKLFYNFFYKLLLQEIIIDLGFKKKEIIIDSYLSHLLISVWKRNSNLYFPLKIHQIIIILSLQVLPDKTHFFFLSLSFYFSPKVTAPKPTQLYTFDYACGYKMSQKGTDF